MINVPSTKDKILCGFLYTGIFIGFMTIVPLAWIIIANIRKIYLKDFVKYHCYQAVLFNMIVFFLPSLFSLLIEFLTNILSMLVVFDNTISLINLLCVWILKAYDVLVKVIAFYGIIWTWRGRYTYIPPLSQAVNHLLR